MPSIPPALDTKIAGITPENIAFEYQLAGPFRRLPAYLIDVAVRWLIIALLAVSMTLVAVVSFGPFAVAGMFVAYFLVSWFYGTVMETYFNGRTTSRASPSMASDR